MKYNRLILIVAVAALALAVVLLLASSVSAQEEVITSTLTCPPPGCPLGNYKYEWDGQHWVADPNNPEITTWWLTEESDEHHVCWEIAGNYCLEWWCAKYGWTTVTLGADQQCFTTPWWDLSHVTAKLTGCATPITLAAFGAVGASLAPQGYPTTLVLLGVAVLGLSCMLAHTLHLRRS